MDAQVAEQSPEISQLAALVSDQAQAISALQKENADLKKDFKKLVNQLKAVSTTEVAEAKPAVKPGIPTNLVEIEGTKYRFKAAKFRIPGDSTEYLSQEVAFQEQVLNKLLSIPGQQVLVEHAS